MSIFYNMSSIDLIPSEVIGEGSYGCIHKPSLICKDNKKISYKNKISKLLLTEYAIRELKEYMLISETDKKNQYFLGIPSLCKIKPSKLALKAIKKCKRLTKKHKISEKLIDNYSLLIMNDGGVDLEQFGLKCKKLEINDINQTKVSDFWKETGRILNGLLVFQTHNIIHFDLKPQNIVYNEKTNRINFIDFGHMRKITDAITDAKNNNNRLIESAFWNYPFEIQFLNKNKYIETAQLSMEGKKEWMHHFLSDLQNRENSEFVIAYETFMDIFTENLSNEEQIEIDKQYKYDFYKTLTQQIILENYEKNVEKSIKTIDVYGIGLAFKIVLNYTSHLLPRKFTDKMNEICYFMTTPDLSKRYMINEIISQHTEALKLL